MKLGEIANILGSTLGSIDSSERHPLGYSIDSRTVRAGEMFFAIRGENYDGHRFVQGALERGAIAAVVDDSAAQIDNINLIRVSDTLVALQSLAAAAIRNWQGREVAITGSMGKTTTKEMTAAALAQAGRVIKTLGNLNNDYGLPLSILKMESDGAQASDFDYAILEMGMNHKGEIARLAQIAPPDVGVVTIVAPVHLEFFDSVEAIADAKAELIAGIKTNGAAVLNADDERVARMREMRSDIEYRTFGIESAADVTARDIQSDGLSGTRFKLVTPRGNVDARLAVAGRHNVYNALAAAAVADFYEVSLEHIATALAESSSPRMRGEVLRFSEGFTVVDDSYNSNPRALVEMVTTICANKDCERKIVIAGEMLELGATGAELHRKAGRRIAALGVDLLIGVRGLAREIVAGAREAGMSLESAIFCETPNEAADVLTREARAGDLILIKGSRGVKTEIVVERMKQARGQVSGAGSR
ncbi:MAG TPA: UDP-N-acetylmuramoyl-tripeptide--D-alanyl-D-alanine ligase [Blastocatellia bacterium]|nr:UDP-N-acetylmuramoyl-tripeptide--D-alanyl-D-alanine ligase [Blastocatellia bacterium]